LRDGGNELKPDEFIAPYCDAQIEVLYEDDYLLVIDKPSGLLSLSGKNPLNKDSVHWRLLQLYPSATMVHRLDFGTSGLMVVALDKLTNAHLTKQFQSQSIEKRYVAKLYGHLLDDQGFIDAPIVKSIFPFQKICYQSGKASYTEYAVTHRYKDIETGTKVTRVIFTPKTGRTHQLRVHSLKIGHPIIGCDLYNLSMSGLNTTHLSDRLCLHASKLVFEHPISGERLCFDSECDLIFLDLNCFPLSSV